MTVSNWLNLSAVIDLFKDLAESYRKAKQAHNTYVELIRLSDKELKDIGISRSDITAIANEVFYDDYPLQKRGK